METSADAQEKKNLTPQTPENNASIEEAENAAEKNTKLAIENFSAKNSEKIDSIKTYPGAESSDNENAAEIGEIAIKKILDSLIKQLTDWQAKNTRSAPRAIKYTVDEITAFCNKNKLPIPQIVIDATPAPKEKKPSTKKKKSVAPTTTIINAAVPEKTETPVAENTIESPVSISESSQEENAAETPTPSTVIEKPAVESPKVNIDTLTKEISTLPDKSLDKNVAFQMAGIADKTTGEMLEKSWGGNAFKTLLEIDKFKDITANELALKLIEKGNSSRIYGVDKDIDKTEKGKLKFAEDRLAEFVKESNGNIEKGMQLLKNEKPDQYEVLNEERALVKKMKKLSASFDRQALFNAAITKKNEITPDNINFFIKGDINFNELIGKLIDNKYSKDSLKNFVKFAPKESLSLELSKKLSAVDSEFLGGLEKTYPEKFIAE